MRHTLPTSDDGSHTGTPCVIYAAKSTEDKRGSIATQLADCRAAAEAEGRIVVAEYSDEAASAFHGDRGPGLRAALEHAEHLAAGHRFAEMWCQHPDRLARGDGLHAAHLVEYVLRTRKVGVQLRAVEHDDTFRDLIRAVLTGERNHEDSARKAAATQAGLRRVAERGEWPGGVCPDGYRVLRDVDERGRVTRRVELDPDRVSIYRLHFDLALAGYSDRAIVLALDERGYRTRPLKAQHRPRPFDANRVRQTLTNPFYAGLAVYRREIVGPGQWPAIVSPEDFDRIRAERRRRANADGVPKGRPPEGYVLARRAKCGACGSAMDVVTGRHVRKDGTRARRYVCRAHRERPQDCAAQPIDATVIDRAFVANLASFLGDVESWRGRLVASREAERQRMKDEVARAHDAVATSERVIDAAQHRYAARLAAGDEDTAAGIEEFLHSQRCERQRAERRLAAAVAALASTEEDEGLDPLLDFYNGLSAELAGRVEGARGDVKRLNAAVTEFFSRVELHHTAAGVRILPVLSDEASRRILLGRMQWPHGVEVGETRVERIDDDTELRITPVEPIGPPAITATDREILVPPLRTIETATQNARSPW